MNELQTIHGLHEFYHNLRFTSKKSKGKIIFLDLVLKFLLVFIPSLQIVTSTYIMIRATLNILQDQ